MIDTPGRMSRVREQQIECGCADSGIETSEVPIPNPDDRHNQDHIRTDGQDPRDQGIECRGLGLSDRDRGSPGSALGVSGRLHGFYAWNRTDQHVARPCRTDHCGGTRAQGPRPRSAQRDVDDQENQERDPDKEHPAAVEVRFEFRTPDDTGIPEHPQGQKSRADQQGQKTPYKLRPR